MPYEKRNTARCFEDAGSCFDVRTSTIISTLSFCSAKVAAHPAKGHAHPNTTIFELFGLLGIEEERVILQPEVSGVQVHLASPWRRLVREDHGMFRGRSCRPKLVKIVEVCSTMPEIRSSYNTQFFLSSFGRVSVLEKRHHSPVELKRVYQFVLLRAHIIRIGRKMLRRHPSCGYSMFWVDWPTYQYLLRPFC